MNSTKTKDNLKKQNGLVLILLILILPFFIGLATLVMDLGRMFIAIREAQNLADVIANTGSYLLLYNKGNSTGQRLTDWKDIKPAAKQFAIQIPILNASQVTSADFFTDGDGSTTVKDDPQYQKDTLETAPSGDKYALSIYVERGIRCFDSVTSTDVDFPVDREINFWCHANYTKAKVKLKNMSILFGKFFGFTQFSEVTRSAVAHVRPLPDSCQRPNCSDYSTWLEVVGPADGRYLQVISPPPPSFPCS